MQVYVFWCYKLFIGFRSSILAILCYSTGVIGSNVPGIDCPASNAIAWVITITE